MATETARRAQHWDRIYQQGDTTRSWFQAEPAQSLRMIDLARISVAGGIIDIGGGSSRLVDALTERGYSDITVLDVSATALHAARERLGAAAATVTWICTDLLTWAPERSYALWHDRAVFHFLTEPTERRWYLRALRAATTAGSTAVFGCFALDGPEQCSGLPVVRYDATGIADQLGSAWTLTAEDREDHTTPTGRVQPFTWAVLRCTR